MSTKQGDLAVSTVAVPNKSTAKFKHLCILAVGRNGMIEESPNVDIASEFLEHGFGVAVLTNGKSKVVTNDEKTDNDNENWNGSIISLFPACYAHLIFPVEADLSNKDSIDAAFTHIAKEISAQLSVLVYNAVTPHEINALKEHNFDIYSKQFNIGVSGFLQCIHHFVNNTDDNKKCIILTGHGFADGIICKQFGNETNTLFASIKAAQSNVVNGLQGRLLKNNEIKLCEIRSFDTLFNSLGGSNKGESYFDAVREHMGCKYTYTNMDADFTQDDMITTTIYGTTGQNVAVYIKTIGTTKYYFANVANVSPLVTTTDATAGTWTISSNGNSARIVVGIQNSGTNNNWYYWGVSGSGSSYSLSSSSDTVSTTTKAEYFTFKPVKPSSSWCNQFKIRNNGTGRWITVSSTGDVGTSLTAGSATIFEVST